MFSFQKFKKQQSIIYITHHHPPPTKKKKKETRKEKIGTHKYADMHRKKYFSYARIVHK